MIITNKYNLPESIIKALENNEYTKGDADISVTSLIDSFRIFFLRSKHEGEITRDASEMLYALEGTALHNILCQADPSKQKEKRLYMDIEGVRISGQFDRITVDGVTLQDYKRVSTWEWIFGVKEEKKKQINIYKYLCEKNGIHVEELQLILFFRDWFESQAKRNPEYPQTQIITYNVDVWTNKEIEAYILERVREFKRIKESGEIPLCTREERWAKDDSYAVIKKGNKKATKVTRSEIEAQEYIYNKGLDATIEYRPGEDVRCKKHCPVREFCEQNLYQ